MAEHEVVVGGLPLAEGPTWMPDGTLACTSILEGWIYRIRPETGDKERWAETGGGPNGSTPTTDGGLVVAQNSGWVSRMGLIPDVEPLPLIVPGLQRVHPDGRVETLLDSGFQSPNDLAVLPDGKLYFTDPAVLRGPADFEAYQAAIATHDWGPEEAWLGRVWALDLAGSTTLVRRFWFPNGIGYDRDGQLLVIEGRGLQRRRADGSWEWVIEDLGPGPGDGFCVDVDGRYYIASTVAHGIHVIEDGEEVEFLELPGEGSVTNCCFGGPDLRSLYATELLPGNVVVWEHMPTPGRPVLTWPV